LQSDIDWRYSVLQRKKAVFKRLHPHIAHSLSSIELIRQAPMMYHVENDVERQEDAT